MISRLITYDIAVYPLVYKFLAYHYPTSPFLISQRNGQKNPYASYLDGCLDRYDMREMEMPRKYERLTASLTLAISSWHIKRFAAGKLSPRKVSAFNDFVRQMFFEKMTQEVLLHTLLGMGVRAAIERFLDRYGIGEDDLPMEVAMRYYGRIRRKLRVEQLTYCPVSAGPRAVILSHERDSANGPMESGWRQVA